MTKEEKEDRVIQAAAQMDIMAARLSEMAKDLRANPTQFQIAYRSAYKFRGDFAKNVLALLKFGNPSLKGHS